MITIQGTGLRVYPIGDKKYLVKGIVTKKYLMLPVEDKAEVAKMSVVVNNEAKKHLNVRLATKKVEYHVPLDISEFKGKQISLVIEGAIKEAVCWENIQEADKFDRTNREKFKPIYHFSPDYGWMNDPNGMVYKDGVYHLCFQYNPYGSTWENMSWGHATTKDLITWKHEPDALHGDGFGGMFSGGAVVDKFNSAGFGKDAIIAFYTNAGVGQMQCIAYSLDNGKTFTKYENNPVLTSEIADFRDPKVFWHDATKRWIMILAVDQHMEIFSSENLKDWTYESSYGEKEGAHGGVWECPDLVELPIEGTNLKKWVLICNINPGGPFGGSATQYFVGTFDGKKFINDSPLKTKWMDFGKDYYATVTWANAPENRCIALGWMSNWQYANEVPTQQFRSATSIPRDLVLFEENGEVYLKGIIVKELDPFVKNGDTVKDIHVKSEYEMKDIFMGKTPAYCLDINLAVNDADTVGIKLFNNKNEEVTLSFDIREREFSMNRAKSGMTGFDPSETFENETISPIYGGAEQISLRILVDTSSIEVFGNDGKFTMTNLVFPEESFNNIRFFSKGGSYVVESFTKRAIQVK